jgi:hypothetical protein
MVLHRIMVEMVQAIEATVNNAAAQMTAWQEHWNR